MPCLTKDNVADGALLHAELGRDVDLLHASSMKRANFADLIRSEPGVDSVPLSDSWKVGHSGVNDGLTYAKLYRNIALFVTIAVQFASLFDLRFRKMAWRGPVSSLGFAISHVVTLVTQKQVTGAKTWGCIASVANIKAIWDWAKSFNPSLPMDQPLSIWIPGLKLSIASLVLSARPFHARIIIGYSLKEFLQKLETANLVSHRRALHWLGCMASATVARCGAFSMIPQPIEGELA